MASDSNEFVQIYCFLLPLKVCQASGLTGPSDSILSLAASLF